MTLTIIGLCFLLAGYGLFRLGAQREEPGAQGTFGIFAIGVGIVLLIAVAFVGFNTASPTDHGFGLLVVIAPFAITTIFALRFMMRRPSKGRLWPGALALSCGIAGVIAIAAYQSARPASVYSDSDLATKAAATPSAQEWADLNNPPADATDPPEWKPTPEPTVDPWPPQTGNLYILGRNAGSTTCSDDLDALNAGLDALGKNDKDGYMQAMWGHVVNLNSGVYVLVLNYDILKGILDLRVHSGDLAGARVYCLTGNDNNGFISKDVGPPQE